MIDTAKIRNLLRELEKAQKALAWLREYGPELSSSGDSVGVEVTVKFARSCEGATEAELTMERFALLRIEDIVSDATKNCENTIDILSARISEEAADE